MILRSLVEVMLPLRIALTLVIFTAAAQGAMGMHSGRSKKWTIHEIARL